MGIAGPRVLDSWLTRGPVYSWEGLGATAGRHLRETDWMACSPGLVGGGYRTSFHTLNASEDWVLALPLVSFPNGLASLTLSSCSVLVFLSLPPCHLLSSGRFPLPSLFLSLLLFAFSFCRLLSLFSL